MITRLISLKIYHLVTYVGAKLDPQRIRSVCCLQTDTLLTQFAYLTQSTLFLLRVLRIPNLYAICRWEHSVSVLHAKNLTCAHFSFFSKK